MEIVRGIVKTTVDSSNRGRVKALFPKVDKFKDEPQWVTYTSPFYRVNGGGMAAIPEVDDEILAAYDPDEPEDENFYYYSTVVRARPARPGDISEPEGDAEKENFEPLRVTDPKCKIYNSENKPKAQTFTNAAGAGLLINRDFSKNHIHSDVTLKSEHGEEVNVGSLGAQIKNNQGDFINLSSGEPDDGYGARSLTMQTEGSQRQTCLTGNINMKIKNGGDINIENNSDGTNSIAYQAATGSLGLGFSPTPPNPAPGAFPWAGNIRLKSRYRNIDLAALGEYSRVNIITNNGRIVIDNQANKIDIVSTGDINFESKTGSINFNAPLGSLNFFANSPTGSINLNSGSLNAVNSIGTFINNTAIEYIPRSTDPLTANERITPVIPPPVGLPQIFIPNDYRDGIAPGSDGITQGAI